MKILGPVWTCCLIVLLTGCATDKPEKVFLDNALVDKQKPTENRTAILFPEYFLQDEYVLHDHGHIRGSRLIGAGMSANLDLSTVRQQFSDMLHYYQWETDTMEIGSQSFRILASHEGETVEIRGVQGSSGPTHIFLLYTPKAD